MTASEAPAPTAFFTRTYDEALELLIEARDYVAGAEAEDRARLGVVDRLRLSCEATRITARLTHIMAWLLYRRAIHAGEIPPAAAADASCRLGGAPVCAEDTGAWARHASPRFHSLLERSRRLYVRVARLDGLAARAGA